MSYDKVVDSQVLDGYFDDIADAIRDKNYTQNTYTPTQMPQAIRDISGAPTIRDARYLFIDNNTRLTDLADCLIQTNYMGHMFENNQEVTDSQVANIFSNPNNRFNIDAVQESRTLQSMFANTKITEFNFDWINKNNYPLRLNYMFNNCSFLNNILANNTVKIDSLEYAFQNCSNIQNCYLNNFIISGNCNYAFNKNTVLEKVFAPYSNTSIISSTAYMFSENNALNEFILDNNNKCFLDQVSNVTSTAYMFQKCEQLKSIKLDNFSLGTDARLQYMFYACTRLEKIDMLWDATNPAYNTQNMFSSCNSMRDLIIRWTGGVPNLTNANSISGLRSDCKIWVPDDLVSAYQNASIWTSRSFYIRPLSQYVEG